MRNGVLEFATEKQQRKMKIRIKKRGEDEREIVEEEIEEEEI